MKKSFIRWLCLILAVSAQNSFAVPDFSSYYLSASTNREKCGFVAFTNACPPLVRFYRVEKLKEEKSLSQTNSQWHGSYSCGSTCIKIKNILCDTIQTNVYGSCSYGDEHWSASGNADITNGWIITRTSDSEPSITNVYYGVGCEGNALDWQDKSGEYNLELQDIRGASSHWNKGTVVEEISETRKKNVRDLYAGDFADYLGHDSNQLDLSGEVPTAELMSPYQVAPSSHEGLGSASASIAVNQASVDFTGARQYFELKSPKGHFNLTYVLSVQFPTNNSIPGLNLPATNILRTNIIECDGNGKNQTYPPGKAVAIRPPYAKVNNGCEDFYIGGTATLALLPFISIDDGHDTPSPCQKSSGCAGMPIWWVSEPYINLWIADKPVGYTTSLGEKLDFSITHNQRDTRPKLIHGRTPFLPINGWNNNWYSYVHVEANPASGSSIATFADWTATAYLAGGGEMTFAHDHPMDATTGMQLLPMNGVNGSVADANAPYGSHGFRLVHSDGSQDVYGMVTPLYPTTSTGNVSLVLEKIDITNSIQMRWSAGGIAPYGAYEYEDYQPECVADFGVPLHNQSAFPKPHILSDFEYRVTPIIRTNGPCLIEHPLAVDALLTEHIDPYGNSVRLQYVNATNGGTLGYRLDSLVDYDGKITTFGYDANGFIVSVNMPYGRTASLNYAASASPRLLSIIDAENMTSSFGYDANGIIIGMTTPYGTTGFGQYDLDPKSLTKFKNQLNRAAVIQNPDGTKEIYAFYKQSSNSAPAQYAASEIPPAVENVGFVSDTGNTSETEGHMDQRNSFYWGKQQTPLMSSTSIAGGGLNGLTTNDFNLGRMSHWLLQSDGTTLSGAASLVREQSPDGQALGLKTWYIYPGTYSWILSSSGNENATVVFRKMPDGSTWYQRNLYNYFSQPIGNISTYTQPDGETGLTGQGFRYQEFDYAQIVGGVSNSWKASLLVEQASPGSRWSYQNEPEALSITGSYANESGTANSLTGVFPHWPALQVYRTANDTRIIYFNDRAQVTGSKESTGLTTTNIYGSDGFLAKSIALEIKATNTYGFGGGLLASKLDASGLATSYGWDGLERLTNITFPDGTSIQKVYNRLDVVGQKDRLNHWQYFDYDSNRHLIYAIDPNGNVSTRTYCICGGLESIIDPQANSTIYSRNLSGWVTSVINLNAQSNQLTRTFTHDSWGRVTQMTDSSGLSLNYTLNMQGLATNVSSSFGTVFSGNFNEMNQPLISRNGDGIGVTNVYDELGRLTEQSTATGFTQRHYYTGLLENYSTDGLGRNTFYGYDPAGRLESRTDANNNTNGFIYTPSGRLAALADGNGHVTTWVYDIYGQTLRKTDGNGVLTETNSYNANGWVTKHWTPAKGLTRYTNDANGNLTGISYNSGTNIIASYDGLNRLECMIDSVGTNGFTYQNFGAFRSATASEDGPWANDTVTYGYNQGVLQSLTLAQPNTSIWSENYGYDALLRLQNLTSPAGTFTYGYSGAGRQIHSIALPGGNGIAKTFDGAGQLLSTALKHGATVLDSYGYAYDANGNRTSVTRANNASVNYGYDAISQLVSATGYEPDGVTVRGNENFSYGYDAAGNLFQRTNNTLEQTFTTDGANQLLSVARNNDLLTVAGSLNGSNSFTINGQAATIYRDLTFAVTNGVPLANGFNVLTAIVTSNSVTMTNKTAEFLPNSVTIANDANGNLISDGLHGYDYDCANQLTRVTVTNILKTEFAYDGFGRRRVRREYVWQTNQWALANEVRYVYDGLLVIQERNSNNVPVVSYTRGLDLSGTLQGAGGIGGLLARTDTNGSAFYHADGNGNVMMLMDAAGNQKAKYLYDPFGNPLGMWGTLATANTYRFSSMETYENLVLYTYRVYFPNLQRWGQRDPIDEDGGLNLYRFVGNDSVGGVDLLGLDPCKWLWDRVGNYMKKISSSSNGKKSFAQAGGGRENNKLLDNVPQAEQPAEPLPNPQPVRENQFCITYDKNNGEAYGGPVYDLTRDHNLPPTAPQKQSPHVLPSPVINPFYLFLPSSTPNNYINPRFPNLKSSKQKIPLVLNPEGVLTLEFTLDKNYFKAK